MSTEAAYATLLATLHRVDLLSRRVADQQLISEVGVGRAMFLVLELLSEAGPEGISQQAIADRVGLTKAAVSRHVGAGQQEGWLEARPSLSSRRENRITLTVAGEDLVARGRRHRAEASRAAVAALGAREIEGASRTLSRLADLLEQRLVS